MISIYSTRLATVMAMFVEYMFIALMITPVICSNKLATSHAHIELLNSLTHSAWTL